MENYGNEAHHDSIEWDIKAGTQILLASNGRHHKERGYQILLDNWKVPFSPKWDKKMLQPSLINLVVTLMSVGTLKNSFFEALLIADFKVQSSRKIAQEILWRMEFSKFSIYSDRSKLQISLWSPSRKLLLLLIIGKSLYGEQNTSKWRTVRLS